MVSGRRMEPLYEAPGYLRSRNCYRQGSALILGFEPGWAALGLVLFTIVASIVFLDFWNEEGEGARRRHRHVEDQLRSYRRLIDRGRSLGRPNSRVIQELLCSGACFLPLRAS